MSRRTTATDADRLVALMRLVSGGPRNLIQNLDIIDHNYAVALELLESNYGVASVETKRVMGSINKVPAVNGASDVKGLRQWLNHVQSSILAMDGIGVPLQDYALSYESTICGALPDSLLFDFEERRAASSAVPDSSVRKSESAELTVRALVDYVRRYTCLKERSTIDQAGQRPQQQQQRQPTSLRMPTGARRQSPPRAFKPRVAGRVPPHFNRQSTVAGATTQNPPPSRACFFCKATTHGPSRCEANLSYQQRCEIVDQLHKCRVCFCKRHREPRECRGPRDPCRTCQNRHHYSSMHPPAEVNTGNGIVTAASSSLGPPTGVPRALVAMCSAFVVHNDSRLPVRIFLDPGATISFAAPSLLDQLTGLSAVGRADIDIQAFSSVHRIETQRFRLRLASTYDEQARVDLSVYKHDFGVHPSIDCPPKVLAAIRKFGRSHPLADRALVSSLPDSPPALLVGIDQYYKIVKLGCERPIIDGIVAKESRFGWIVSGPVVSTSPPASLHHVHAICCPATMSRAAQEIQRLWALDAIGITEDVEAPQSVDEQSAVRQFEEGLCYDGSSYTVPMPSRPSIRTLANNADTALHRLQSKRRSLLRTPATFERYHQEIMTFVREEFAEEVPFCSRSLGAIDGSYYMPHRQVITHVNGVEKWRIVFDCSSSAAGQTSLNSHLLPGPNANPDLVALIINFRLHKVAVSADIARAYMMISIRSEDRPLFRFLWQGPGDDTVRCFQMKRVTWGATPSGFLLASTLRSLFKRVDPGNAFRLGDAFYHDDMVRSFAGPSDAISFITHVINWLESAGMHLAKWKTSSSAVAEHLRAMGAAVELPSTSGSGFLKVLGLAWDTQRDEFRLDLPQVVADAGQTAHATKRSVLRAVASVFDPLGWLLPLLLRGKLLIQQLWSLSLKWDDEIPGPLLGDFRCLCSEVGELVGLRIPRWIGPADAKVAGYHLHLFGDASEKAYAAVAYLQVLYDDGTSACSLVMAKSRLAPRGGPSIPRLELLAALLTVRLRRFLIARLSVEVDRVFHYTDSAVTYFWCTSEQPTRWRAFVCNRVEEIQRYSDPSEWFHTPGSKNIADIATRGISATDLKVNREWWSGPEWLQLPEAERPVKKLCADDQPIADVTAERRVCVASAVIVAPLIDLRRFSTYESAVRTAANVVRFCFLRCRRQAPAESDLRQFAERHLIRCVQATYFTDEVAATRAGDRPSARSKLSAFTLFIDEHGLLLARTRLTRGPHFTHDEANPIVLPGESRLAELLILSFHRINAHFGASVILSAVRRRFWVTRARQVIRSLLRRCVICRRHQGPPADQVQGPLPSCRVSLLAPYATTGVDFCGPFYTRGAGGTVKNYVALFTCASVRAVHLELVPSMATPTTHLALRRFLAAHPGCTQLISDNGRSFVKAASDVKRLFNSVRDPPSRELLAQRRIRWSFYCPRAPWRGGFIERVVGTVKSALTKTLGRSLISYEELRTILAEIAAIVNDRPISYVAADAGAPLPLTPAQFVHGGPTPAALCSSLPLDHLGPNGDLGAAPPAANELRTQLVQRTNYFKALSVRWFREYMLLLRSANVDNTGRPRVIRNGDVCLVKEDNQSRIKWNLVRVLEAHPGRDAAVRTYTVKFANGHTSRRAAQLLHPLEIVE